LITLSKWRFQLRYACFSPWMDNWSLHTCLASLGSTKPSCCTDYNSSLMLPLGNMVSLSPYQFLNWIIARTIVNRLRASPLETQSRCGQLLNSSKLFYDKSILIDGCLSVIVYFIIKSIYSQWPECHQENIPKSLLSHCTWILSRITYGS